MTREDCKQQLLNWCHEQGEWKARAQVAEADTEFALTLDAPGPAKIVVEAWGRQDEDWIEFYHTVKVPKASIGEPVSIEGPPEKASWNPLIDSIVNARAALLEGEIESSGKSYLVSFSYRVYLDGLNKQSFIGGLDELRKARKMFDAIVDQLEQQRAEITRLRESFAEAPGRRERAVPDERPSLLEVPPRGTPPPIPPPAMRHCAKCGQVLAAGKKFCTACGAAVT